MQLRNGFTLIELLVTISILGVVLALIGPLGMEQLDRTLRLSERQTLEQTLAHEQRNAFLTAANAELKFSGKTLVISSSNKEQKQVEFRELFFPPQVIVIDAHGMPSVQKLSFNAGARTLSLELNQQAGL